MPRVPKAAPFAEWILSERSWWIPVAPAERIDIARRLKPGTLGGFAMIFGGALGALLAMKGLKLTLSHPLTAILFSCSLLGFVVAFGHARLVARWARQAVARRSGRLFTPDRTCAFIGLEPADTYDRLKIVPDEIGFARVTPEAIQFELQDWRACLHREDITAEAASRDGKSFNVRLRCGRGDRTLTIVFVPLCLPRGAPPGLALAGRARATWLMRWLGLREAAALPPPVIVRGAKPG